MYSFKITYKSKLLISVKYILFSVRDLQFLMFSLASECSEWEGSAIKYNKTVRISSSPADVPADQGKVQKERSLHLESSLPFLALT
jgi:hypothetical protein